MSSQLNKTYDPVAVEAEAIRVWEAENCFHADPAAPGEPYTIVIPPPNVTGALHLGHAINNTLQDILTRVHRMRGFNTLWVPGIDHAGIATQAVVEKQLKEKENKTRHDIGREELVARIWKWKEQYGNRIIEQLKRLGCSCDWDRTRFTLDDMCARAVRETFFKLFKDGLIYRGKRLVNWDVHLQTSISDDEIYHETVKTSLWHIRYPIDGTDKSMIVATTRPETMLGDTAVAVHPEDPRWNWAVGKQVKLPLTDRLIPIIKDEILVDPKFGTGVVKVTPAHDPNDYAVWQRHQGKADQIDLINILNPAGTINENGGPYNGMKRDAARKKVVDDLTALGLLVKEEPYETQVGHSDRSKTPVEPYLSDQWFVKMAPLAEPALQVVRDGIIKFFPERHAQQYLAWLGEKRDWPISRQLWWGHRIPVWSLIITMPKFSGDLNQYLEQERTKRDLVVQLLKDYFVSAGVDFDNEVFISPCADDNLRTIQFSVRTKLANDALDAFGRMAESYRPKEHGIPNTVLNTVPGFEAATPAYFKLKREIFGMSGIPQDPDVLDTWFSSALWPHSTLGWPEQTAELKKYYPTSVLLTGRDIITLWVARMVMTGLYNMKDVPFHHVAINPTILDGKGERMSKSKGNGVDPVEIIDTHSADALRFTLTLMATETQDVRLPVKKDSQGRNTSDKFDIGRNFANKLWNAARFTLENLQSAGISPSPGNPGEGRGEGLQNANNCVGPHPSPLPEYRERGQSGSPSLVERWIISRFNRAVVEANAALAVYRFDQYAKVCYDFFWRDFCDWYVEAIKPRMKDHQHAAETARVLAAVLDGSLRLLHPMIPFITETIWWKLNEVCPQRGIPGLFECPSSNRLIKAAWPVAGKVDDEAETVFARLQEIITGIRNLRSAGKVDLKHVVDVSINRLQDPDPRKFFEQHPDQMKLIENYAHCRIVDFDNVNQNDVASLWSRVGEFDIFMRANIDAKAESDRVSIRKDELKRQIATLKARLDNPGYAAKAPAHLVEQTRAELGKAEAELAKLA